MDNISNLKHNSFRASLLRTFILFQTLLMLLGVNFVIDGYTHGHDSLQEAIVVLEADSFIKKYLKNPNTPLPMGTTFKTYLGTTDMPSEYKTLFDGLSVGLHELEVVEKLNYDQDHEFRVLIKETKEGGPLLYFVSDIPEEEAERVLYRDATNVILFYLAFSLVLGVCLAWMFSRAISKPLESIINSVKSTAAENPSTNLSQLVKKGEVGVLAKVLDDRNKRISDFIQREKEVMRNISHELRTPITIIKSSLALLANGGEASMSMHGQASNAQNRHIDKIARATKDLESMVEAFLWLGREGDKTDVYCDATLQVEKAITDHDYLIEDKDIVFRLNIDRQVSLQCKEKLFYIASANLIRNACIHTDKGTISVTLSPNELTVIDQGPGIDPAIIDKIKQAGVKSSWSNGFGLGLHIVDQICQKMRWTLVINNNQAESGTKVSIYF